LASKEATTGTFSETGAAAPLILGAGLKMEQGEERQQKKQKYSNL
jgi:hypothetical protein